MKLMRILGIIFLLVTTIGALIAGYSLVTDPSGTGLNMPLKYLDHSPFTDYLIPGIILFTVIGIFGLTVLLATMIRMKYFEALQVIYGVLLTGWIVIQVLLLQFTYYLLYIFVIIGVFMIALGLLFWRVKSNRNTQSDDMEYYQTLK